MITGSSVIAVAPVKQHQKEKPVTAALRRRLPAFEIDTAEAFFLSRCASSRAVIRQ
jgi:hypothetical protein